MIMNENNLLTSVKMKEERNNNIVSIYYVENMMCGLNVSAGK